MDFTQNTAIVQALSFFDWLAGARTTTVLCYEKYLTLWHISLKIIFLHEKYNVWRECVTLESTVLKKSRNH